MAETAPADRALAATETANVLAGELREETTRLRAEAAATRAEAELERRHGDDRVKDLRAALQLIRDQTGAHTAGHS